MELSDGDVVLGALVLVAASLLAGTAGFGFGLVATPLLLALGLPLRFVITINLALAVGIRLGLSIRLRHAMDRRRVGTLIVCAVPGAALGTLVLEAVDPAWLRAAAGAVAIAAALALLRTRPPERPLSGGAPVAGALGGLLAATTSLVAVAPALLLARERVTGLHAVADLAAYTVAVSVATLVLLALRGELVGEALRWALVGLPIVLAGTWLGTAVAARLAPARFRALTLAVVLASGLLAVVTA